MKNPTEMDDDEFGEYDYDEDEEDYEDEEQQYLRSLSCSMEEDEGGEDGEQHNDSGSNLDSSSSEDSEVEEIGNRVYVFLQDAPPHIEVKECSDGLKKLDTSGKVEFLRYEQTSPGNFAIQVSSEDQKKYLLTHHPSATITDSKGNIYFLPFQSEGEVPPLHPPPVLCPICNLVLDAFTEAERNTHVLSCVGVNTEPAVNQKSSTYTSKNPAPLQGYSPFAVVCPYVSCGKYFEAYNLPSHVEFNHVNETHTYQCPICVMSGQASYKVTSETNLLSHLRKWHGELKSPQPEKIEIIKNNTHNTNTSTNKTPNCKKKILIKNKSPDKEKRVIRPPVVYAENQPGDYIAEICQMKITMECVICYNDFNVGCCIARLPCLCMFHQNCVEKWFEKKAKRVCPLHLECKL